MATETRESDRETRNGLATSCLVMFIVMSASAVFGLAGALPTKDFIGVSILVAGALAVLGGYIFSVVLKVVPKPEPKARALPPAVRVFPKITVSPKDQRARCPYCHADFAQNTRAKRSCPGCRGIYHEDCLRESEGCTTLGCRHIGPRRPSLRV